MGLRNRDGGVQEMPTFASAPDRTELSPTAVAATAISKTGNN